MEYAADLRDEFWWSTPPEDPRPLDVWRNPLDTLEYVFIPAGRFIMGDMPRHRVRITSGFWLCRTPVTAQAFARFCRACRDYRLSQEFITPYTPEQNGMIERFFRSLKEECTWLHNFETFEEAKKAITTWIHYYNEERPHQSLGYLSPHQYRAQQCNQVA